MMKYVTCLSNGTKATWTLTLSRSLPRSSPKRRTKDRPLLPLPPMCLTTSWTLLVRRVPENGPSIPPSISEFLSLSLVFFYFFVLWFMVYGLWFMVYGLWFMVYGLWFMVYGLWFM